MQRTLSYTLSRRHVVMLVRVAAAAALSVGCGEDDDDSPTADRNMSAAAGAGTTQPEPVAPAAAPVAPATPPSAATPSLPPGTLAVCERPESAHFDAGSRAWYVSCMAKRDVPDDGYVAKLNADATEIVAEKFVTGLDEPKGIRVNDGKLYVSNVSELVTADLATGSTLTTTTVIGIDARVPEQSSLNDVTVDRRTGDVYVSDNRNDVLYRFDAEGGSPESLYRGEALEGPNGLLVDDRDPAAPRLLIASLGPGLDPMRGVTAKLGAVIALSLPDLDDGDDALETTYVSQRIGNLDGIELYGNDLLVSDFFAGRVLRLTPTLASPAFDEGDGQIVRQSLANSADLGIDVDADVIVVPETANGTIVKIDLDP